MKSGRQFDRWKEGDGRKREVTENAVVFSDSLKQTNQPTF
jgi:hypothetical protein